MFDDESLEQALQLAPIVERVHGSHHPELTRVRELTEALDVSNDSAQTAELFKELRQLTNNYSIPEDACEAYTATYEALKSVEASQQFEPNRY